MTTDFKNRYLLNCVQHTNTSDEPYTPLSSTQNKSKYNNSYFDTAISPKAQVESTLERVASWFLNKESMSNKKLQKLCYYAYCWYIVFFNDAETTSKSSERNMQVLCEDRFQAWIHGPVSPRLYHRYKAYGWHSIPKVETKPIIAPEIEDLLKQVWEAYGAFNADELEALSHQEAPWKNARKDVRYGEACSNEISNYDILQYYASLGA